MLYLDTSVLVAALTNEPSTQRVQDWLESQDPLSLLISYWVETEFSAALAMKTRMGQITPEMRSVSLSDFAYLKAHALNVVDIKQSHFLAAARMTDTISFGLRAPDALHLAVLMDMGATLCTLDKKFANSATMIGAVVNLLPDSL